jgi:hypothetical protein
MECHGKGGRCTAAVVRAAGRDGKIAAHTVSAFLIELVVDDIHHAGICDGEHLGIVQIALLYESFVWLLLFPNLGILKIVATKVALLRIIKKKERKRGYK